VADIGDVYRISTVITNQADTLVDPVSVTLTVTDPAGATTTPTPTNDGTGLYHADVALTAAGRWRWTWATTTPTGVDHGFVDVSANPTARLDPLATVDDLEEFVTLTDAQRARAPALIRNASVQVRRFCRQDFDLVTGDEVVLRPIGTKLRLPQRPVIAVNSVTAVGSNGIPDFTLAGWTFDGVDLIDIAGIDTDTFVSLPAWWEDYGAGINTYRPNYDHGYPITPDDIKGKVCQMVNRVLTADTQVEGITQETIGQYSRQWQQATGSTGVTTVLTRSDRQDLIDWGYRRTAGTIQTHIR